MNSPYCIRLQDVPADLADVLLPYLPVGDLQNLRLAGLGSTCPAWHARLRLELRRRTMFLHPMYKTWKQDWDVFPRAELSLLPTEFAGFQELELLPVTNDTLSAVGRDMPRLRFLTISNNFSLKGRTAQRLKTLPDQLRSCEQVNELILCGHDFETLPEAVLSLSNLTALDLSNNKRLHSLPDDMGTRLHRLESLGLYGCSVQHLPASLLETLERNHTNCDGECGSGVWGFEGSRLPFMRYPKLWRCANTFCG